MSQLYREDIIEYSRHSPYNRRLKEKTISQSGNNPLCGDRVTIDVLIENNQIKEIGFDAQGCVISKAAMAILAEVVQGKKLAEVEKISPSEVTLQFGKNLSPSRVKCAILGLETLKQMITSYKEHEN